MPCWQVRTISVEFKAQHRDLLDEALNDLGWEVLEQNVYGILVRPKGSRDSIRLDLVRGEATFDEQMQDRLNELKVGYSRAAVRKVAKQKGWQCKFETATQGKFIKKQWG